MLTGPELREGALSYCFNVEIDVDPAGTHDAKEMPNLAMAVVGGSSGQGGRWYKGDLHAHSEHSDGRNTVDQIIGCVRGAGLDHFALTDHNTISHWEDWCASTAARPCSSAAKR